MNQEALIHLLDQASDYLLSHGKRVQEKPYDFDSGMSGSDAVSVSARTVVHSIKRKGVELQQRDIHINRSSGTYSRDWSEKDERTIEMYLGDKMIIKATKCLGGMSGRSGMMNYLKNQIEPTNWSIEKTDSLDKVVRYLVKIKAVKR